MAVAEAHVAELEEFAAEPHRHLRAAWGRGVPLLVLVEEGRRRLVVDTVVDLEIVHYALVRAEKEGGPGPS